LAKSKPILCGLSELCVDRRLPRVIGMRARVYVTLKPSVFDPQGRTIAEAGMFDAWKLMMSNAFVHMIKATTGLDTDMRTERAPEHERSGRA
jgi:hypothetical protein